MSKTKIYLEAFRLRTLPLALAGIIMGGMLAGANHVFDWKIFSMAILTTLFLQILSNLANDFGDSQHGTDNDNRIGPKRTVQGGLISKKEMKQLIALFVSLSLTSGIILLLLAYQQIGIQGMLILLGFGIASVLAALFYTMGKNPYGYIGLGDLFVFLFFGLLSVLGSYFLMTGDFEPTNLIPAISIGFLSAGVLNLNNMRDHENDRISGKHTLVVRFGLRNAKFYHYFLIGISLILAIVQLIWLKQSLIMLLFLVPVIPLFVNIQKVYNIQKAADFDPELKKLALSTLLFAFSYGLFLFIPV